MRKIFIISILLLHFQTASEAAVQLKVTALSEFKTDNPSSTINVAMRENSWLGNYELKTGDILKCNVVDVSDPKRGKRNAVFYVQPFEYLSNGISYPVEEKMFGKYSKTVLSKEELKNLPKGQLIEKAAETVGSFYIKGLGQGISLAKGLIQNQEGNRLKSGVKQVYNDSFLSYVEKGQELDIKEGEDFYFIFNIPTEEEKPNYSYTTN